jgi:Fe-S-cluster-containing dehydrogenase component
VQREDGQYPMVEVSYLAVTCNHCDDPPCLKAAKNGGVTKREDGIVLFDPEKTAGQKQLVASCPYGAVYWNDEKQLPQKWSFDAHLLDKGWTQTRASQVCPTAAMRTLHVEDEEMQRIAREEGLEVLHPEYGTKPRVYYKNLDRFRKSFIGGTLAGKINGSAECVAQARVLLTKGGQAVGETRSDTFGDFRFRGLEADGGVYRVEVADERFKSKAVEVSLKQSAYLGEIMLEPRIA